MVPSGSDRRESTSCILHLPASGGFLIFPGYAHATLISASLFTSPFPLCVCVCGTVKRVFPVAEIHQTVQGGQLTSWAFIESLCRLFFQVRKHSQVLGFGCQRIFVEARHTTRYREGEACTREPNVWPPEMGLHRDGGLLTRHLAKRLVAYFSLKVES